MEDSLNKRRWSKRPATDPDEVDLEEFHLAEGQSTTPLPIPTFTGAAGLDFDLENPWVTDNSFYPEVEDELPLSSELQKRRLLRRSERGYPCDWPECSSVFDRQCDLDRHVKTTHSDLGAKPYKCSRPDCDSTFAYPNDLERHESIHSKYQSRHSCPVENCEFTSMRKSNLQRHVENRHSNSGHVVSFAEIGGTFDRPEAASLTTSAPMDHQYIMQEDYVNALNNFEGAGDRSPWEEVKIHAFPDANDLDGTEIPPHLEQTLRLGDSKQAEEHLKVFIQRNTDSKYFWISELLGMDYSTAEVVELLREQAMDSPWIYFDPPQVNSPKVKEDRHLPGCPHMEHYQQNASTSTNEKGQHSASPASRRQHNEIKNLVEGLCGLGGVAPSSRSKEEWPGTVTFDQGFQNVQITFGLGTEDSGGAMVTSPDPGESGLRRLAKVLYNIHGAASSLQNHHLCCDSFTILVRPFQANYAKLVRVPFSWIARLQSALPRDLSQLKSSSDSTHLLADCEGCKSDHYGCDGKRPCARCIMLSKTCQDDQAVSSQSHLGSEPDILGPYHVPSDLLHPLASSLDDFSWSSNAPWDDSLLKRFAPGEEGGFARATKEAGHIAREFLSGLSILPATMTLPRWVTSLTGSYFSDACLATQVLATGLLSYTQAHISPLKPFFLDRDIETLSLFGSEIMEELVPPQIVLRPFRTTCMNRMLQDEVLVFQHHFESENEGSLDLSASPQDLLDTWGPGCYIKKPGIVAGDPDICGVRIGGGTIMKSLGQTALYHFFPTTVSLPNDTSHQPIHRDQRIMIGAPISVNGHCGNDERMRYRQCDPFLVSLGTHPCIWEQTQSQFAIQGGQYVVVQFAQTWNKTPSATIKKCQLSQHSPLTTSFLENFWGLQVSFCTGIARRVRMRELLADIMAIHVRNQLVVPAVWTELEHENIIEILRNDSNLQDWLGHRSEEQKAYLEKIIRQILERLGPTGVDCTGSLTVAWYRPSKEPRCLRIPCEKESAWAKILADSVDCATYAYFSSKCLETERIKCQGKHSFLQRRSSILSTAVSPHQDFAGTTTVQATFQLKDRQFYRIGDSNLVRAQAIGPDETRLLFYRTSIGKPMLRRIMHKERHSRIRERQDDDSPARPVLILTAD